MLTLSECDAAWRASSDEEAHHEKSRSLEGGWVHGWDDTAGGLTTIEVEVGQGRFLLTAGLSMDEQATVRVDMVPSALRIRSGRISRWVGIPPDARLDGAIVRVSDGLLTVSIPTTELSPVRHVVHVW